MEYLKQLYRPSLGLLTDLYQLTMGYGYWKKGIHERKAIFNLFFRNNPFESGYTIAAGLEPAIEFLTSLQFEESDIQYLSRLTGNDGEALFENDFLEYLGTLKISLDVEAIPEGTLVFPFEPLLKVRGNLLESQLVESALLNIVNFQSLVATKTARIKRAAGSMPIMEFGLRRAQGIDGAISASRAAFIGGASSTSNVLAGKLFNIPVKGTHAHSWVMAFTSELEAFKSYAEVMSNNCVLLVDTYDVAQGVEHAIEVAHLLREKGKKLIGVRIDSGDLAYYSQLARKMLDKAGFPETIIIASNDIDEHIMRSLQEQDARLDSVGVGTRLVTAYDQPALGGVYKLSAIEDENGQWQDTIKLSAQRIKVNIPGDQNVRRVVKNGQFEADILYDQRDALPSPVHFVNPMDPAQFSELKLNELESEDLLVSVMKKGAKCYETPSLTQIQQRVRDQMQQFHKGILRYVNPHTYKVGLEKSLFETREELITKNTASS